MHQQHILVVEDNPSLLAGIEGVLEVEGYRVLTAGNGVEGLKALHRCRPDLIVADIMMPEMDGYAFYEAVRDQPDWTPIPFVFLTAKATREDILKGKALGVEDYITKPFDPKELIVAVQSRLKRAQAIQTASEAQLEKLKQQIAIALSHELRTPLTYVRGYTDLALDNIPMLAPDELEQFLHGIKFGADRLNRLVEDLLVLVQLDTGHIAKEFQMLSEVTEDLDLIIAQAVADFQVNAEEFGVRLETDLDAGLPKVRVLESLFVNALWRLIHNGLKFSKGQGGQVTVSARATAGGVLIAVQDDGIGIAPHEIPRLFQRFRQIDRDKMEQQGLGLGLAISRELIRLHGGEITVESAKDQGSTFSFTLPLTD